jgi:NAD(P)-dependent dehydrogenase (short-subunit alcohol dehydrogenase family)
MAGDGPLSGRLAVVTGALGRLGPVWVSTLEDAGATVVAIDVRESDGVRQADVRDRGALERVRDDVGIPDVLVNSAGIDQPPDAASATYRLEDVPLEEFRETLDVNLAGVFQTIQVFGPAMRDAGRGSIVNIGSLYASVAPEPRFYDHLELDPPFLKPAAYAASKAGVVNLTRYFARLFGPHGVRVNALSPGGVRGEQDDAFRSKYCERVPLGRMAEPDDLRGPLLFLASDASRYVTGHELRVDGGFTA